MKHMHILPVALLNATCFATLKLQMSWISALDKKTVIVIFTITNIAYLNAYLKYIF